MKYTAILLLTFSSTVLMTQDVPKGSNVIRCTIDTDDSYRDVARHILSQGVTIEEKDRDLGYIKTGYFGRREIAVTILIENDTLIFSAVSKEFGVEVSAVGMKKSFARRMFSQMSEFADSIGCLDKEYIKRE